MSYPKTERIEDVVGSADQIVRLIDELEKSKAYHEEAAAAAGAQLAAIRDRLNGRTRKPKSGKFTRRTKGEKAKAEAAAADVTDLIGAGPDV